MSDPPIDWHHLFGLILKDFFTDSPYVVEIDVDLSVKKQMLDVVVIRRHEGNFEGMLPDGFDPLALHNLITFKSHQDSLDAWAIKELIGHYVNYRKQSSPDLKNLHPETDYRLFGICARYPQQLASQTTLDEISEGVYQCPWGTDNVRIIVAGRLPEVQQNALLHLFSADSHRVQYGSEHYQQHSEDTSTLLQRLFGQYRGEGVVVPYTMEDFKKALKKETLAEMTPEELRQEVPSQKYLQGMTEQERENILSAMSIDEIRAYLRKQEESSESSS